MGIFGGDRPDDTLTQFRGCVVQVDDESTANIDQQDGILILICHRENLHA